jgi:hypothetical protein
MKGSYAMHLGEQNTEQFIVSTKVDGKLIREQRIHDPFIHNTTVIGISRWDLFKAMFKKQFEVKVQVCVEGSQGALRAIMMLNPVALQSDTESIIEGRRLSREAYARGDYGLAQECT